MLHNCRVICFICYLDVKSTVALIFKFDLRISQYQVQYGQNFRLSRATNAMLSKAESDRTQSAAKIKVTTVSFGTNLISHFEHRYRWPCSFSPLKPFSLPSDESQVKIAKENFEALLMHRMYRLLEFSSSMHSS